MHAVAIRTVVVRADGRLAARAGASWKDVVERKAAAGSGRRRRPLLTAFAPCLLERYAAGLTVARPANDTTGEYRGPGTRLIEAVVIADGEVVMAE